MSIHNCSKSKRTHLHSDIPSYDRLKLDQTKAKARSEEFFNLLKKKETDILYSMT